ncbi:MAG: fibronectin type III domain-containing protein [Desulfuromonadales bacterium]|nr:fibronectin type III domain-containing protein [Desulfuromonadales bacterium]MDW7756254.1 fibronectin type III domain-containing protein [Desulfuromonadales bacterium]
MKTKLVLSLSTLLLCLLTATLSFAADVTLAWDPNPSTGVTGYKMYYKSGSSTAPFDGTGALEGDSPIIVGDSLSTTLTGLDTGVVYYFTVVAYDAAGNESPFSNIIAWTAGDPDPFIPSLQYPANQASGLPQTVQFDWSDPTDGRDVVYTLYYGTDPTLQSGAVGGVNFEPFYPNKEVLLAIAALSLLSLAIPQRRKIRKAVIPALVGATMLLASCGGGGGGDDAISGSVNTDQPVSAAPQYTDVVDNLTESTFEIFDFDPNTTYYWKVVADDGATVTESSTYSFTTTNS